MTIGIVLLILFFLDHVEALKGKCHKKVIAVQLRNLSLKFETFLFLYAMSFFSSFLSRN